MFRAADGLAESFCTAVSFSPRGNVWVKHTDGQTLSWLDGYSVGTLSAAEMLRFRIAEGRAGQLWSYCAEGLLSCQNREWSRYTVAVVRAELQQSNVFRLVRQNTLLPTEWNRVLILFSDRLLEYAVSRGAVTVIRRAQDTALGGFAELTEAHDGSIWISGARGLARVPAPARRLSAQTPWQEFLPPPELGLINFQRPIDDGRAGCTVVAERADRGAETGPTGASSGARRVLAYFDGERWEVFDLREENLKLGWRGADDTMWVLSVGGLLRFDRRRPDQVVRERPLRGQIFDAAAGRKGVFWLATSEGLARYAPLAWRRPPDAPGAAEPVRAILESENGTLWFSGASGLTVFAQGQWRVMPWPEDFAPRFEASDALRRLPDGRLVISGTDRVELFDPRTERFDLLRPPPGRRLAWILGQLAGGALVVQTETAAGSGEPPRLETWDGAGFSPYLTPPFGWDEETSLFFVKPLANGDVWLGSSRGPALYRDHKWQLFGRAEGYLADGALSLLEFEDGRVWCAGLDRVLEYDGKSWRLVRAGFDRINTLWRARDGSVWVAAGNGLQRYFQGSWIAHGPAEGLPAHLVHDVLEDRHGRLWAATAGGLSRFHPDADTDPPRTLLDPSENPRRLLSDTPVTLVFGGRDRWDYTPPERLLFSYRVDDGAWSDYSGDTTIVLSDLVPGLHRFEVRAMDRNWNEEPQPSLLEFAVIVPWYKETRLVVITAAAGLVALVLGGLAVNRHLHLKRSYAEVGRIVEQRTRELERAQRELFHRQKMTALGTLAAGIAHDFNSILSIVRGSAQIIERNLDDREKILTRVDRIKTAVEQGSGVVKALLGFSRASDKDSGPCDVSAVVDATLKLLGDRFLQDVRVRYEPGGEALRLPGARDLIQQMLLNLVLNAADALGGEGEIVLQAGRLDTLPGNLVLAPAAADHYVYLAVKDTGSGIEPEVLPRIFEPFFTTKALSTRRGTGLGLSMVYQFAKELGFGLRVESEVGRGSTFTIYIPLDAEREASPGRA